MNLVAVSRRHGAAEYAEHPPEGGAPGVLQAEGEENALLPGKGAAERGREGRSPSAAGLGAARLAGSAGAPQDNEVRAAESGFPADF